MAVADATCRAEGFKIPVRSSGSRGAQRTDPDHSRLHELIDRATTVGAMTGADWGELAELVTGVPVLVLHPPRLWRTLSDRLLTELVVAGGVAWFQRQEAMSLLLEHPVACEYAVASCIDLCEDKSSPAVIEPLSLLEAAAQADANMYVLRQIECPTDNRALCGALLAAERKVTKGHISGRHSRDLSHSIRALMKDPSLSADLLPLVVDVGRALARRAPHALGDLHRALPVVPVARQVWETDRLVDPSTSWAASSRIGRLAQAKLSDEPEGEDTTLELLIEQSLFDANSDRRLFAAMLIAATPYKQSVAEALLAEFTADTARGDRIYPASTLRTLTDLYVDVHRSLVRDILLGPGFDDVTRHAAAWAVPHCSGSYSAAEWRHILGRLMGAWRRTSSLLGESIIHGIVYGIGTDGHSQLLAEIRADPVMPTSARATASWLLSTDEVKD